MQTKLFFAVLLVTKSFAADETASVVGAGYGPVAPVAVAPGQVITFYVHGIGTALKTPVVSNATPLPLSLAGITALMVQNSPSVSIPILAVEPLKNCADVTRPLGCGAGYVAVTVQIPFNISAENPTARTGVPTPAAWVQFSENGTVAATIATTPLVDQVHVIRSCDLLLQQRELRCQPSITHADGSLVTQTRPARPGEEIVAYAVGLGYATTFTNNGDAPKEAVRTSIDFRISFDARPNAQASRPSALGERDPAVVSPRFTGLIPSFPGLYQINFVVPSVPATTPRCDQNPLGARVTSNLTINIFGPASVDGVGICVDPSAN